MITYREGELPSRDAVIGLYLANTWSSGKKPDQLMAALESSDHLVIAFDGEALVGLANALSDGHLGSTTPISWFIPMLRARCLMDRMKAHYPDIHQHILVSVPDAVEFYKRAGFSIAENHAPMWIYGGDDG